MRTIIVIALVLGWLSCTPEKKAEHTESPAAVPAPSAVRTPDAPPADTSAASVLTAQVVDPENDKPLLPVKILNTGFFHGDEVWPGVEREHWFGLFKDGQGHYLRATAVTAKRVEDPVLDEAGQKTGWELKASGMDTLILLMAGSNHFANRRLNIARLDTNAIYPGDTVRVTLGNEAYSLYATGNKKKESFANDWYSVSNYKLYLSGHINGRLVNQLLVAHENFDDQMAYIVWAGDIDGDNRLDLIIELSRHYNEEKPGLFLSRPAGAEEFVELVGEHSRVGC